MDLESGSTLEIPSKKDFEILKEILLNIEDENLYLDENSLDIYEKEIDFSRYFNTCALDDEYNDLVYEIENYIESIKDIQKREKFDKLKYSLRGYYENEPGISLFLFTCDENGTFYKEGAYDSIIADFLFDIEEDFFEIKNHDESFKKLPFEEWTLEYIEKVFGNSECPPPKSIFAAKNQAGSRDKFMKVYYYHYDASNGNLLNEDVKIEDLQVHTWSIRDKSKKGNKE